MLVSCCGLGTVTLSLLQSPRGLWVWDEGSIAAETLPSSRFLFASEIACPAWYCQEAWLQGQPLWIYVLTSLAVTLPLWSCLFLMK